MEGVKQKVERMKIDVLPDDFSQYDLIFKLIVIGDSGVGKSCLTFKGIKKYMPDDMQATVGFESYNFVVRIGSDVVRLQIWDTCGQEIYKSLVSNFFRQASCALLVYSIDNMQSFEDLTYWLNDVKSKSNPDVKTILIGNKIDLVDQRQVSTSDGEEFQKENNCELFFETTAKTGDTAENVFIGAAKLLYTNYLYYKTKPKDNVIKPIEAQPNKVLKREYQTAKEKEKQQEKKGGCC